MSQPLRNLKRNQTQKGPCFHLFFKNNSCVNITVLYNFSILLQLTLTLTCSPTSIINLLAIYSFGKYKLYWIVF